MSDSLNATVIVSESVLTISANPELEPLDEDEPDPPRLPAVAAPLAPEPVLDEPEDEDEPLEEPLEEPLDEPPADTVSPGLRLESDAIVPLVGAYNFVLLTAISALWTAACALYTAACAEARLLGDGVDVVVVVEVELVFGAEPLLPADPPLPDGEDPFVLGTTTVTVTLGVVFVTFVPDLEGVPPDPVDPLFGLFVLPEPGVVDPGVGDPGVVDPRVVDPGVVDPGSNAAYSTVALELGV